MFVPKSTLSPIKLPTKPKNAKWNDPPIYIDKLIYRANGKGYLEHGNQQLFIIPTEGGTPRQITFSNHDHEAPVWSPRGDVLYFSANLKKDSEYDLRNSEIYRVNLSARKLDTLTDLDGPITHPVISKDVQKIAFLRYHLSYPPQQVKKLYVMDMNGENTKLISGKFDRDVNGIVWDKEGKGLYFQYDDHGNTKIAYMTLTGKVTDIANHVGGMSLGRPYSNGSFTISSNGRYAYTLTGIDHPADLASGENSNTRRLSNLNKDLFGNRILGNAEEFWFKSSNDGHDIQGWILKPPGFDPNIKYPLILEIHGGPNANYGPRFSAEMQLYAARGYLVLYINPRGSTSYGQEFRDLIYQTDLKSQYDDLMSGVEVAIDKGYVDSNNLFVTGGSYGGYLSAWIIGNTDQFNAAVVAKPIINQYSMSLYTDITFWSLSWFSDYPWNVPEEYLERSPISVVGNVSTPTMILTGEQDYRTPIAESEQFYTALKLRKVDAAFVRIPNSSHQIASKPSNLIAKVSAVLTWFEKYRVDDNNNE
jgi:acylaminoacyl-peptidase